MLHFWHLIHMNVLDLEFNSSDSHRFLQIWQLNGELQVQRLLVAEQKVTDYKMAESENVPHYPTSACTRRDSNSALKFQKVKQI